MIINLHKLLRLPVYTESGKKLGNIFDAELNAEQQVVMRYLVKPFLSVKYLLIDKSLVKEIREDRMVVDDGVIKVNSAVAPVSSPGLSLEE